MTRERKQHMRIAAVYPYLQPEGILKSLGDKCCVYHLLSTLGFWSTQYKYSFPKGPHYYPETQQANQKEILK